MAYCSGSVFIRANRGILSLFSDITSSSGGWPHGIWGVQVQTLKARRVIVCRLLLTYLRVSTRCPAVDQALRLSSIFNQCDSADVTSYWMSRLSREVLLFSTWFINMVFENKCEIYKLHPKRTKHLGSGSIRWLYCHGYYYLQLPFMSVLSLYLCMHTKLWSLYL